jgi:hypothetical protein
MVNTLRPRKPIGFGEGGREDKYTSFPNWCVFEGKNLGSKKRLILHNWEPSKAMKSEKIMMFFHFGLL